ncbi:Na(+)/H(+) antiporter subunit B [Jeotgalicoccus halotolerans]|uniref:Multisubunit sodium/proton antiporter MrpB subunit n=1 Tax=Jeotgalicoccus halotolerans TaxID=157227 RepID=A0A3E0ARI3_9STAP|nr:Na(+)/H(+) antiporter subunit B [Jeotgalicoccus halotolerans]REG20814.1 multisubunit sodium/proton antiporter MrpB subunit [Jeotgalicoccus halotolerans]
MKSTLKRAGYNKVQRQMNDVFIQFTSKVIFLIILLFSVNLFLAGHYTPGGGFVGGLLAASAIILLLMAYDYETVKKMIPVNFHLMISLGLALAIVVPTLLFLFGAPFFTHQHTYVTVPVFGEVALHTAVIFDVGVFLTVAGTSLLIVTLVGGTEK